MTLKAFILFLTNLLPPIIQIYIASSIRLNKDDMLREINQRLEAICTEAKIDSEVRRVWSLHPKLLNRKRITPTECIAAIQQIKQDNRVEVRLRVTQIREMAMIEKYGAPNYQAPDQDLFF